MRDLLSYLQAQGRRLVAPLGAGALTGQWWEEQPPQWSWEERTARCLTWQCHTLGFDLSNLTIPTLDMLEDLGIGTGVLWDGSRYIPSGQLSTREEAAVFFARAPRRPPVLLRHLAALRRGKELCDKPIALGTFGPLTLAGYLMGAEELLVGLVEQPELVRAVLAGITGVLADWHRAGVQAGGDFLWVAEPMAALLSPRHFRAFVRPCLAALFSPEAPAGFLHIPGDTTCLLPELTATGAQCLSLDKPVGMTRALAQVPQNVVLLGDIDAFLLLEGERAEVVQAVDTLRLEIAGHPNVIVSSGGGISPHTPYENIRELFRAAADSVDGPRPGRGGAC